MRCAPDRPVAGTHRPEDERGERPQGRLALLLSQDRQVNDQHDDRQQRCADGEEVNPGASYGREVCRQDAAALLPPSTTPSEVGTRS